MRAMRLMLPLAILLALLLVALASSPSPADQIQEHEDGPSTHEAGQEEPRQAEEEAVQDNGESLEQKQGRGLYELGRNHLAQGDAENALDFLTAAAERDNHDALMLLGTEHLYGEGLGRDLGKAFKYLSRLASFGNGTAQSLVATMYSQGLGTEIDQAKAFLYHNFASFSNQVPSLLALGYRKLYGIGTPKDCEQAAIYYQVVAQRVVERFKRIGSRPLLKERLSDEPPNVAWKDVLQYYRLTAESGDVNSKLVLGQLYLQGGQGIEQDLEEAYRQLHDAATRGNPQAMGLAGTMLLEGVGVERNVKAALNFLKMGAILEDPTSHNGLGLAYLHGLVKEDPKAEQSLPPTPNFDKAIESFNKAAQQGNADAQANLGILHYNGAPGLVRSPEKALGYFTLASKQGHVLAQYYLGLMNLHGVGLPGGIKSCSSGAALMKVVAERDEHARLIERAHQAFMGEELELAATRYLVASEQGHEVAQVNAAFLLEKVDLFKNHNRTKEAAMRLWHRGGVQGNVDGRVRVGDYFYYGWAGPKDYSKASAFYSMAEALNSAQAMFNLGYMHQHGIGITRDVHLAKRFYDKAMAANEEAFLPCSLALAHLLASTLFSGEFDASLLPFEARSPRELLASFSLSDFYDAHETGIILFLCACLALAVFFRQLRYG